MESLVTYEKKDMSNLTTEQRRALSKLAVKPGDDVYEIVTLDNTLVISGSVVDEITVYTNDTEVTCELIGYLKDRVELFNSSINVGVTSSDIAYHDKFEFNDAFVKKLFVSLLKLGFDSEQIMIALDQISDGDFFAPIRKKSEETINDRIEYICECVKSILSCSYEFTSEEESYRNIDEYDYIDYKLVKTDKHKDE